MGVSPHSDETDRVAGRVAAGEPSHDPEQRYFSDGMTDELITSAGEDQRATVFHERLSCNTKARKSPYPKLLGAECRSVLEGTVTWDRNRVITAQLIGAAQRTLVGGEVRREPGGSPDPARPGGECRGAGDSNPDDSAGDADPRLAG